MYKCYHLSYDLGGYVEMEIVDKEAIVDNRMVIGYTRVSTDWQAEEGYGLDVQRTKIFQYRELYDEDGDSPFRLIIDDGYSAKSLNRPGVKELMELVKQKMVKKIYIYKLDRLSRSVVDTYNLFQLLLDCDCTLVAIMDKIDISTANGRLLVGMLAIIAQWERETISERVIASNMQVASQGMWPYGVKPFGYDIDKDKFMHLNVAEFIALRKLGDYVVRYNSLKVAVAKMNEEKVLNKNWNYKTCNTYLNNELYRGTLRIKKVVYEFHHPAIWTEEEWVTIKQAMCRKPIKRQIVNSYIFRNKVYCLECGVRCKQSVTNKKNGVKYIYYTCPNKHGSINQDNLEYLVKFRLVSLFGKVRSNIIKSKRQQYENLKVRREDLYKGFLEGKIGIEVLQDYKDKIDTELQIIDTYIDNEIGRNLKGYSDADNHQKEMIISEFCDKIIVSFKNTEVKEVISNETI